MLSIIALSSFQLIAFEKKADETQHTSLPDAAVLERMSNQRGPYQNTFEDNVLVNKISKPNKINRCKGPKCQYDDTSIVVKLTDQVGDTRLQAKSSSQSTANKADLLAEANLTRVFKSAKKPNIKAKIMTVDGQVIQKPDLTRWVKVKLPQGMSVDDALDSLENDPRVEFAEANLYRSLNINEPVQDITPTINAIPPNDPDIGKQWHLDTSKVKDAWQWLDDNGYQAGGNRDIVVAVIDTGVDYNHEDLAINMWVNQGETADNGIDDDNNGFIDDIHGVSTVGSKWDHNGDPLDDHGHGTHVAGVIAAQSNNGIGITGIAYNVQIMAIKAAQYSGVLTSSDIAEAVNYAAQQGADVINMSFGGTGRSLIEEDALASAFGKAVLIASAGNSGLPNEACLPRYAAYYPASYNWVLGVMAQAPTPNSKGDNLAGFSNWDCKAKNGIEYEVMAPGVDISSTLPNNGYAAWDGTSMAAPVVSGIAALLRTKFNDKTVHSSRFLMGQLGATGTLMQGITYSPYKPPLFYHSTDALAALTNTPKPSLSYLEHWLWDEAITDPANDNDGIIDAGETIDLAVVVRNYWGQADNVDVKIEAITQGIALTDPYITWITDTVNYGSVGTYSNDDNGLIYENDEVTGIANPFRFTVDANTPNNHIIPFKVTFTASNGLDPEDATIYSSTSRFEMIVHRGRELPSIIGGDVTGTPGGDLDTDGVEDGIVTLDDTALYIIDKPVLIEQGVTLKVGPGAVIQFWGSQADDSYAVFQNAYLQVEGTFDVAGSVEKPVTLKPSNLFPDRMVVIRHNNAESFNIFHANITNLLQSQKSSENKPVYDHVEFRRGYEGYLLHSFKDQDNNWHTIYASSLGSSIYEWGYSDTNDHEVEVKNSRFIGLGALYKEYGEDSRVEYLTFKMPSVTGSLIERNNFRLQYYKQRKTPGILSNNVLLNNTKTAPSGGVFASTIESQGNDFKIINSTVINGKTYAILSAFSADTQLVHQAQSFANSVSEGSSVLVISDAQEKQDVSSWLQTVHALSVDDWKNVGSCIGFEKKCYDLINAENYYYQYLIGLIKQPDNSYSWINAETPEFDFTIGHYNWEDDPHNAPVVSVNYSNLSITGIETDYPTSKKVLLEFDSEISLSELTSIASNYEFSNPNSKNNAYLNQWWDANPDHWLKIDAGKADSSRFYDATLDLSGNYWGTTNTNLIGYSIVDYTDDFNKAKGKFTPLLEVAPESAYPFVADVKLLDGDSAERADLRFNAEAMVWQVSFNRDMDMAVQPNVSFGPDYPYTDFSVEGDWIDARTWQGNVNISPVASDGYQYVRVQGAVAADDAWLVTGNDYARYRFEVITSGTESLNLQASGGDGYVELMWSQDDFDLLHGFNLYRSTSVDSGFTRIHQTLIANDVRTFRDENVQPGVAYYYYFKVMTEAGESEASNTSSAIPTDTVKPVISHSQISTSAYGANLLVQANVTDNIGVETVTLFYRLKGDTEYIALEMTLSTGSEYRASIPGADMVSPGVEYYIVASDGSSTTYSGRADTPKSIVVDDAPVITNLSPITGADNGGTLITVVGANFKDGVTLSLGGAACTPVEFISVSQVKCTTAAHYPELVSITATNPDAKQGQKIKAFTYMGDNVAVGLANVQGATGQVIEVPLNISGANGLAAYETTINFDATLLQLSAVRKGNLIPGWNISTHQPSTGVLNIAAASASSKTSGAGELAVLEFVVLANQEVSSNITIASLSLNDNAITATTFSGQFTYFSGFDIEGNVNYWGPAQNVVSAQVKLNNQDAVISSIDDGTYKISGVLAGANTVKLSKDDQAEGITAYDASLILMHASGKSLLSATAQLAADANNNGSVTALDAFEVLNYVAGLSELPFNNNLSKWQFTPESHDFADLQINQANVNFSAILTGDVSGNWQTVSVAGAGDSAFVSFYNRREVSDGQVAVDLIMDPNGKGVSGIELELDFSAGATLAQVTKSVQVESWSLVSNDTQTQKLTIAMANSEALTAQKMLMTLTFNIVDETQKLDLSHGMLNESLISASAIHLTSTASDVDGDGVLDTGDAFPFDATESYDTDGDGMGNNSDTDDDGDDVLDINDAFPLDASETIDTDGDLIGNNTDTDDDGDGYTDVDEVTTGSNPLDVADVPADNDGDFISNTTDADDDNDGVIDTLDDFPFDANESVDTDGDGIGNNADNDDDGDGIIDEDDSAPLNDSIGDDESPVFSELVDVTFEATGTNTALELVVPEVTDNNLNAPSVVSDYSDALPLGTHEITWTATDYAGNVSTATQLVTIVDTTKPKFDELQTQSIDAMGVHSDISDAINNVQAYDLVDGNINAVVIGDTIYPSGAHLVPVTATDSSGNIVEADVEVHINPLVELSQSRKVEPGATVLLPVTLSGNAAVYPVEVTYTLMQSGSIIETNELLIAADISGDITIEIPNDALDGDVYSVAITSASNAALGFVTSTQLTVDEANFAPTLTLVTQQNGNNISVVDTTNGVVTVTAIINDINVNDTHDIVWSSLNDTLVDLNTDGVASTFEFTAEGLTTDTYELTVSVSESNTSKLFSVIVDMDIVVDASLAALDESTDSDNDGVSDADEGYSDSDNDGISDYLDDDDNPSRLPIDDSTAAMQTVNGLSLSLGDVVTTSEGATAANATVNANDITEDTHFTTLSSITNFNVSGLTEVGQSVPIVIPLASGNTIAEGSVYRKYNETKGWFDFVVNSENGVYSASADEDGNCPYPLSTQYQAGLTVGDNCIQLLIKDGGENDADGLANGMVKDPGVLTLEVTNQAPTVSIDSHASSYDEGTTISLTATGADEDDDTLSYEWEQTSGPTVTLSGASSASVTFTAPSVSSDQTLEFKVTISDGVDTVSKTTAVTIKNVAPVTPPVTPPKESGGGGGSMGWILIVISFGLLRKRLVKVAA